MSTTPRLDLLPAAARPVVGTFVAEQARARAHVVIYLSGAHAYGFPSPDSDVDLKAVHLAPTRDLVGLRERTTTADVAEIRDGVELDYTSNELGPVLAGLLAGNANYIERVLGDATVVGSGLLDELRPLARRTLSRRVFAAYRGFARAQSKALEEKPTVKRILYVLRTLTTGEHLLRTGEVVPDLSVLANVHGMPEVHELIARKREGERTAMSPAEVARYQPMMERARARLEEARAASPLPEEPAHGDELEAWLLEVRRARWDG
jgi:predicted nucleotidyltransferase